MVAILRAPATGSDQFVVFSRDADATVEQGTFRFPFEHDSELLGVELTAGDAPVGADLIFDVELDAFDGGGTVYTTVAKPTIVAGANEGTAPAPDIVDVDAGHYVTVDILQPGSVTPGSKLVVKILFRRSS